MKKVYIRPEIWINDFHLETALLTMSQLEVNPNEETEEDFAPKRGSDYDLWD